MVINKEKYCIFSTSSIRQAMQKIDNNLIGAVFVVKDNYFIEGIITDGIIRRALLSGCEMDDRIENIYFKDFKYIRNCSNKKMAMDFMVSNKIRQVPVIDDDGILQDIYFLDSILRYNKKNNYVFILAGGLGTRLRPLTENIPKPMLKIGDKPLLLRIIELFKRYGFENFIISINYKGDIIENYFKDGEKFGVNIKYVKEKKCLGTSGSISMARELLTEPFIVINGDILTDLNFEDILEYHLKSDLDLTVGTRSYEIKVPYGVLTSNELCITSLEEKPTYSYNINAGVYVINPNLIDYIPAESEYNMTDLIEDSISNGEKCGIYNIIGYWADIGQIDDYNRVNGEVDRFFY